MKHFIVLLTALFLSLSIQGQQDPQYTQYLYNMNIINPAYAGSYDALSLNFLARAQWVGIDGAPQTFTLGINSPVGNNVGLGLSVISDKIGPVQEQNVYGDFSYTLQVGETANLALGLKAGFGFFNVCLSCLETTNPDDVAFVSRKVDKILPNFGVGAYYYTEKFYAGLSIPNLLKTFHFEKSGGQITTASEVSHAFLTTGYVFDISEDVKLKPSTMLKVAEGSPLSIDFTGSVLLYDKLEFGLSYRLDESVSGIFSARIKNSLRFGYAYDYTLSNISGFNSGSHEVFILFNFDFERNKIRSPRFF